MTKRNYDGVKKKGKKQGYGHIFPKLKESRISWSKLNLARNSIEVCEALTNNKMDTHFIMYLRCKWPFTKLKIWNQIFDSICSLKIF